MTFTMSIFVQLIISAKKIASELKVVEEKLPQTQNQRGIGRIHDEQCGGNAVCRHCTGHYNYRTD